MIDDRGTLRGIQEVLNRGYGEQATSPLDRTVADQILQYMRSIGWISPRELSVVVDSAGGKVVITDTQLITEPKELFWIRNPENNSITISVRKNG